MSEPLILALAGNPNSGKTTLFNALTGARQSVGNYPGVTVEKREGFLNADGRRLHIVDLPGTYSLTAYSQEELVARDYLIAERPRLIIDILDANSLERNLYLAVQFLELGTPTMIVLNMMDEVRRSGKQINAAQLSALLDLPVVETVARTGEGKAELVEKAIAYAEERQSRWRPLVISYGPDIDPVLAEMTRIIEAEGVLRGQAPGRWIALKYLEGDVQIRSLVAESGAVQEALDALVGRVENHCQATLEMTPEAIIADYRYGFIASMLRQGVVVSGGHRERIALSDSIDRFLTHRLVGPALMVGVLYAMFVVTFALGQMPMELLERLFGWMGEMGTRVLPPGHLRSMVVDGIIAGVGGVLGFVPLIMIMFLGIAFLEDSGYMARMAYMMDRVLRIFGLHGCSVMPFIIAGGIPGGCAVPGVMGTRTLRSPKEKLATLMVTPFMPCGAKVPVFMLVGAVFFQNAAAMVMFWVTIGAWVMALLVAWVLRNTVIRGEATPFVMELPPYRLPTLKGLMIHTWERAWQYIRKAGTVILAISVLIWAGMTFPTLPADRAAVFQAEKAGLAAQLTGAAPADAAEIRQRITRVERQEKSAQLRNSIAGRIGIALEPVTRLVGFDWRINIALVGGFAAKEVIIATLGTVYAMEESDTGLSRNLANRLRNDPQWTMVTGLSLVIFVMLYAPCFVTVVAMAKESAWKWALFSVVLNTLIAFCLSALVYQVGHRLLQ